MAALGFDGFAPSVRGTGPHPRSVVLQHALAATAPTNQRLQLGWDSELASAAHRQLLDWQRLVQPAKSKARIWK